MLATDELVSPYVKSLRHELRELQHSNLNYTGWHISLQPPTIKVGVSDLWLCAPCSNCKHNYHTTLPANSMISKTSFWAAAISVRSICQVPLISVRSICQVPLFLCEVYVKCRYFCAKYMSSAAISVRSICQVPLIFPNLC